MNYRSFLRESMKKNEKEAKELLQRERQKQIDEIIQNSGIPMRFRGKTFENYNPDDNPIAYKKAKHFAESFPDVDKGLLLVGTVGTGKTHLAAAISNMLINKLYSVYFGNATDIMSFIKSTYSKDAKITEGEAINLMTEDINLLVIDDLGKENETSNTLAVLYQIVNRLYENEKPVIITTNYNSIDLARKLGERGQAIVSRITGMCKPIQFKGEDWRLKE